MDLNTLLAIATPFLILGFAAVIALVSGWSTARDQKRIDEYHLRLKKIEAEAQQAVIDCEELWTQWDWERERGLR